MGKDGIGEIINIAVAAFAMITLTITLALMKSTAFDLVRLAPDAADAFRPTHLADTLIALGVVDQVVDPEHIRSML
jgi:hypothetical protein